MTHFVVQVPEDQEQFFLEFLNKQNFKHHTTLEKDMNIPQWHKDIVLLRKTNTSKEDYIDWETMMEKLDDNV